MLDISMCGSNPSKHIQTKHRFESGRVIGEQEWGHDGDVLNSDGKNISTSRAPNFADFSQHAWILNFRFYACPSLREAVVQGKSHGFPATVAGGTGGP